MFSDYKGTTHAATLSFYFRNCERRTRNR